MTAKKKATKKKAPTRSTRSTPVRAEPGSSCWRGGERLAVRKVDDRFTVRLARGVDAERFASAHRVTPGCGLQRQRIQEFQVSKTRCEATMEKARKGGEVDFVSHVYSLADDSTSRLYLTDEVLAQFEPEATDTDISGLLAGLRLELLKEVEGLERAFVLRVTSQATNNPLKIAAQLRENPLVSECEPNLAIATATYHQPTDGLFSSQWHLHHEGGPFLADEAHIDAARAWDITRGKRSVVVAVADDSVDTGHRDLGGEGKIVAPRDFQGRDFDPSPGARADNHGTACAGVAVAEENGQGVVGVAPGCALMPLRTSGFLDDNSIEELFAWVREQGADVVSCSWGAAAAYFPLSLRQRHAIHRAATEGRGGLGCVIVFAAGNANRPVNKTVQERGWPRGLFRGETRWLAGFAAHPDVVAVSACTSETRKSAYSNWGAEISVCAPSNNGHPGIADPRQPGSRLPTFPRVTGTLRGRGVVTTDRVGQPGYSTTDFTATFGGTSSACPIVAGVAALVLSAGGTLTAREVREVLENTADKIEDLTTDPQLGQALGTYDENGHSDWFGSGRVNAFQAVTEAVRRRASVRSEMFSQASAPSLAIPDNDSGGRSDTLIFEEQAVVDWIKVGVDLDHSWKGDLRLTLIAPSGDFVVLQDRVGGGAENVRRTFEPTETPALARLAGQSLAGDWTLHVQDLAARDTGVLKSWALDIQGRVDVAVELEDLAGVTIPDNDSRGIERTLSTALEGHVRNLRVAVDITHTFVRDLTVTLVSPLGTEVVLHNREGGSNDNVIRTFAASDTPTLLAVRGEAFHGEWKLRVTDQEGRDVGKLNRWGLRIERLARAPAEVELVSEPVHC